LCLIDRNLMNKALLILAMIQQGKFYWREVDCNSNYAQSLFQKYNRKTSPRAKTCKKLEEKCVNGKITERELHFCKRKIEDKIPLNHPNDLDIIIKTIAKSEDIIVAYLKMESEEEKLLMGKVFKYEEVKSCFLPVLTYPELTTVWFLSCKLIDNEGEVQILTIYPSRFNMNLQECFHYELERLKRTTKPSTKIVKILIPPMVVGSIHRTV